MAFPVVAATNGSQEDSQTTSHTVALPADISSGDLLLVFFAVEGLNTITFPEGWTEIFEVAQSTEVTFGIAYRQADGEEGATITVISSISNYSAHVTFRITGHEDPGTQAPEVSTGATGYSQTADPDALTPTGGAKDYLWLALVGFDTGYNIDGFPTDYTDGAWREEGHVSAGHCRRELNAASEDPGIFTFQYSGVDWVACTLAVHPAAVGWTGTISGVTNPAKIMGVDVANIHSVKGVVAG